MPSALDSSVARSSATRSSSSSCMARCALRSRRVTISVPLSPMRLTRRVTGTMLPSKRRTTVSDRMASATPCPTSLQKQFARRGVGGEDLQAVDVDQPHRVEQTFDQRGPVFERGTRFWGCHPASLRGTTSGSKK
jgi:hypothetical protein